MAGSLCCGVETTVQYTTEMTTHSSILAWRIPWTKEPVGYSPWGHKESDTTEATEHTRHTYSNKN